MKIAIEAQRIFRRNKHGMDFVVLESIKKLQEIDFENEYYILTAPGPDHCLNETKNFHIVEIKGNFYPLWEQIALPFALKKIKPDFLHCTSNTAPIFCKYPLVLTLHDIIFLEPRQTKNKSFYQNLGRIYRRIVVPAILPKCKKIITVSEYERNHICRTLKLSKEQITYIYNGFNNHFTDVVPDKTIIEKYIQAPEYLFFLGNTDPKKNVPRTLRAYKKYLDRSKKKLPLLIADMKEKLVIDLLEDVHCQEILPYLTCPGYIPNKELAHILGGASIFLYTSLRESFGIPILEAMAIGTPVITGNTTAMPEIAGKGGALVSTGDEEEIANKLLELENNADYYQEQVDYGLERVNKFSWTNTANELLALYNNLKTSL